MQPGRIIPESDLWPDGTYPRVPLLVEFAGADNPGRGWHRHQSDETAILWRYDRAAGAFVELGRVVAPNKLWPLLLAPLVMDVMRQNDRAPVDLDAIRERISRVLAAELDLVGDSDRARVLTLIHDELAARIAEWTPAKGVEGVVLRC